MVNEWIRFIMFVNGFAVIRPLATGFVIAVCLASCWAAPPAWAQTSPILTISSPSNQIIRISWPAPSLNSVLQEASTLMDPTAWQSSSLPINSNGATLFVSIITIDTARFFRLAGTPPFGATGNYISNGLVAYWKFNDDGGTVAADSSGNGRDLPLIGLPMWGSNYLTLNGITQYGDAGSNTLVSLDQHDKTLCAWINKTGNSQKGIVDKSYNLAGIGNGGWGFWVQSNGNLLWTVEDNQGFYDNGNMAVIPGFWTFVTIVWHYSTSRAEFYINGLLNSIANNGGAAEQASDAADLQVGNLRNNLSGGVYAFDGSIRQVGIYDRALSAAEIQTNYLATELTTNLNIPSLLYYKMTEQAQSDPPIYLTDSSTHGATTGTVFTATDLPWVTNQASIQRAAMHFNGVSTYIDTSNGELFNFTTNSFSINLWLNPLTANGYVLANGFYHGNGWFMSVGSSYELNFGAENFGSENVIYTINPVKGWPGTYDMVTVTRHGNDYPLIYINGALVATTGSFTSPASSANSLVVGVTKAGANYLDGDVWLLQMWNTALSPNDVANLYFNQLPGMPWP